MHIIEPCCATKHLMQLRDALGKNGTAKFRGYGDLSLTELLPAILTRYSETEMMIIAPSLPDQAADIIKKWMKRQRARMDGKGKLDYIKHLTVVASMAKRKSPNASMWVKENPFGDRLTIIDKAQAETMILLPDFAIVGAVNMRYGANFVAIATTEAERIKELWEQAQKIKKGQAAFATAKPAGETAETGAADGETVGNNPSTSNPSPAAFATGEPAVEASGTVAASGTGEEVITE